MILIRASTESRPWSAPRAPVWLRRVRRPPTGSKARRPARRSFWAGALSSRPVCGSSPCALGGGCRLKGSCRFCRDACPAPARPTPTWRKRTSISSSFPRRPSGPARSALPTRTSWRPRLTPPFEACRPSCNASTGGGGSTRRRSSPPRPARGACASTRQMLHTRCDARSAPRTVRSPARVRLAPPHRNHARGGDGALPRGWLARGTGAGRR